MKNRNIKVVALLPAQKQTDAEILDRLVRERVDEILASRTDLLMRPFFDSKRVSDELRRLQTMPERRKWGRYFDRHGCMICETKQHSHRGLGMCSNCYVRIFLRLMAILAEDERTQERQRIGQSLDSIARESLRYAIDTLPSGKAPRDNQSSKTSRRPAKETDSARPTGNSLTIRSRSDGR